MNATAPAAPTAPAPDSLQRLSSTYGETLVQFCHRETAQQWANWGRQSIQWGNETIRPENSAAERNRIIRKLEENRHDLSTLTPDERATLAKP